MKVEVYNKKRVWRSKHRFGPPFVCPWASEGCNWIGLEQREHQDHIRRVHELPGLEERCEANKKEKIAQWGRTRS